MDTIYKEIIIPSSKSIAQRAILCAAFGNSKSIIKNITFCDDVKAAIDVARELGAIITMYDNTLEIIGIKSFQNIKSNCFHVQESGTLCRMLIPILALLKKECTVYGAGTLNSRDMSSFLTMIKNENIIFKTNNDHLPILINGDGYKNKNVILNGYTTSQYISGIIMAYAISNIGECHFIINNCSSYHYVQITLDVLAKFGVQFIINKMDNISIDIVMKTNNSLKSTQLTIENDWSSFAAIYCAISLLSKEDILIKNLNFNSFQSDIQIIKYINQYFQNCEHYNENDLLIHPLNKENIQKFSIDISTCPDIFPYLACIAAFSKDWCELIGIEKLVNKECDRGKVIFEEFSHLGINCYIKDNHSIFIKHGIFHTNEYDTHNDHRIAQVLLILNLYNNKVINKDMCCISKSYPNFINDINYACGRNIWK